MDSHKGLVPDYDWTEATDRALRAVEGRTDAAAAGLLHVSESTVNRWRELRLAGEPIPEPRAKPRAVLLSFITGNGASAPAYDEELAILHPDASRVYRSIDAETWEPFSTGWPAIDASCRVWACQDGVGGWVSIAQRADGVIVATGVKGKMMRSLDLGRSWATVPLPVVGNLNGIHSDGSRFVVVGNDGTLLVSSVGR